MSLVQGGKGGGWDLGAPQQGASSRGCRPGPGVTAGCHTEVCVDPPCGACEDRHSINPKHVCTRSELHENAAPLQVILQYCPLFLGSVLPAALSCFQAAWPRPGHSLGTVLCKPPSAALGDPGSFSQFGFASRSFSSLTASAGGEGRAAWGHGRRWPCDPRGGWDVEGQVSAGPCAAEGGVHVGSRGVLSASSDAKQPPGRRTLCQGTQCEVAAGWLRSD